MPAVSFINDTDPLWTEMVLVMSLLEDWHGWTKMQKYFPGLRLHEGNPHFDIPWTRALNQPMIFSWVTSAPRCITSIHAYSLEQTGHLLFLLCGSISPPYHSQHWKMDQNSQELMVHFFRSRGLVPWETLHSWSPCGDPSLFPHSSVKYQKKRKKISMAPVMQCCLYPPSLTEIIMTQSYKQETPLN